MVDIVSISVCVCVCIQPKVGNIPLVIVATQNAFKCTCSMTSKGHWS